MKRWLHLVTATFFAYASSDNCDKYGVRLYEDMACKPKFSGGKCPTSYDCTLKSSNSSQCVVRGKIYNSGEPIPEDTTGHTCEFGCTCNRPDITCPEWGCGDWAGVPPVPFGCHRIYSLDACCATDVLCPPFRDTTKCLVDGVEYKAREKFFPKDSCYACLCQKGFKGKFEAPFCKRRGCDAQVKYQDQIQKSCAPIYKKQSDDGEARCCPSEWTCPNGYEIIKSSGKKSDLTCKYGEKTLQIGDNFEKEVNKTQVSKMKVKCVCKIPPLVMCEKI